MRQIERVRTKCRTTNRLWLRRHRGGSPPANSSWCTAKTKSKKRGPQIAPKPPESFEIVFVTSLASPSLRGEPIVDIPADLILCQSVTFLNLAFELIATTVDDVEVVIGELTPLLLHFALGLFPISLNTVP